MEKGQREYFLRQQLKAIQDELGEGDEQQAEVERAARAARRAGAARGRPQGGRARALAAREAAAGRGRVRRHPHVPRLDPDAARGTRRPRTTSTSTRRGRILDEDHFDLEKVKDRIVEYLAVSKLKGDVAGPILCFVGPPGVGKTSLGQSIARTLGRKFVAHLGRRRPRRGRDPRPPAHVHRRDAGHDHPRAARRRVEEPGLPDRRDRQDGRRLARRPVERDARGARPGAELDLPRPLPRPAVRPLEGAVHLHREPAGDDPRPAARPHGRDPALRLHRGGEGRDREALPRPEAARGARAEGRSRSSSTTTRSGSIIREYTREAGLRNLERRIGGRAAQGGDAGRRGRGGARRRSTRRAVRECARPAPLLRRGAQAHLRPGRRDRARGHRGRRRRPLHRGDGLPGQGAAADHRPARRGDAGVRAGRALVGAQPRRASSGSTRTGSPSTTSTSTCRPARCPKDGPSAGSDDGDRDRLARHRAAPSPTRSG